MKHIYVLFFGVLGVAIRYVLYIIWYRPQSAWTTWIINLTGAFLIGVVHVIATEKLLISPAIKNGLMIGLLGGFTTFSTFCLETYTFISEQNLKLAIIYGLGSPLTGLLATALSIWATKCII